MHENYYSKLDLCNRFCYSTIYKLDYNLIEYITLNFSFDHIELTESNDTIDLVTVSLANFNFEVNSTVKIKSESKTGTADTLNTCSHEIFLFNKKRIKHLLNKYLINDVNSINIKKLTSEKTSSIFCFEISLDSNDFQTFFPEVLKKKLNYTVPKIFLKVFLKKNIISFLHF